MALDSSLHYVDLPRLPSIHVIPTSLNASQVPYLASRFSPIRAFRLVDQPNRKCPSIMSLAVKMDQVMITAFSLEIFGPQMYLLLNKN